jgi:hypothetical protein
MKVKTGMWLPPLVEDVGDGGERLQYAVNMAVDIHFFNGYPAFGSGAPVDRGNQILRNILEKCG